LLGLVGFVGLLMSDGGADVGRSVSPVTHVARYAVVVVRGTVSWEHDEPVADAELEFRLTPPDDRHAVPLPVAGSAVTDAAGAFAVELPADTMFYVGIRSDSLKLREDRRLKTGATAEQRVDYVLPSACTLHVRGLEPHEAAWPDAEVLLWETGESIPVGRTTLSGWDGRFTGVTMGATVAVVFLARGPQDRDEGFVLARDVEIVSRDQELLVALPETLAAAPGHADRPDKVTAEAAGEAWTFSWVLVDPEGVNSYLSGVLPLHGGSTTVRLTAADGTEMLQAVNRGFGSSTKGVVTARLPPPVEVEVELAGRTFREIGVMPGDRVLFVLDRPFEDDHPVTVIYEPEYLPVQIMAYGEDGSGFVTSSEAHPLVARYPDGRYSFRAVGTESKEDLTGSFVVDASAGPVTVPIVFTDPAGLSGLVLPLPLEGENVAVQVRRRGVTGLIDIAMTEAYRTDGLYRFTQLEEGAHVITVVSLSKSDVSVGLADVDLLAGSETRVNLAKPEPGTQAVTFALSGASNALVSAVDTEGREVFFALREGEPVNLHLPSPAVSYLARTGVFGAVHGVVAGERVDIKF